MIPSSILPYMSQPSSAMGRRCDTSLVVGTFWHFDNHNGFLQPYRLLGGDSSTPQKQPEWCGQDVSSDVDE